METITIHADLAAAFAAAEAEASEDRWGKYSGDDKIATCFYWEADVTGGCSEFVCGVDDGGYYAAFLEVTDTERAAFGFGPEITRFLVTQSDSGFIHGEAATEAEYVKYLADHTPADDDDSDDDTDTE